MDDDLKKIKKMTLFMRKQGLLRVKTSEIELELSPIAIECDLLRVQGALPPEPERDIPEQPTADDIAFGLVPGTSARLFWSTPGQVPGEDS